MTAPRMARLVAVSASDTLRAAERTADFRAPPAVLLGPGRIVVSEIEVLIIFVILL